MVRDRLSGAEAARFFSLIGLIMILAPAIAPGIGSAILAQYDWRAIFIMLCIYPLIVAVLLKWVVFPGQITSPAHRATVSVWQRYRAVFATRPALRFMFLQALSFAVMMLFITHSAFIYQQYFGAGPTAFSLLFGANIILMLVANPTNRWLLKRISSKRILRWAITTQHPGLLYGVLCATRRDRICINGRDTVCDGGPDFCWFRYVAGDGDRGGAGAGCLLAVVSGTGMDLTVWTNGMD